MLNLPNSFVRMGDGYINLSHISRIEIVPSNDPQLKLLVNKEWVFIDGEEAVNFLHWINEKFLISIPQARKPGTEAATDLDVGNNMLADEFEFFVTNQDELVKKHRGKVLAIKGRQVIGVFDDIIEAYVQTRKEHQPGTFMLQSCQPGVEAYTITISTINLSSRNAACL